MDTQTEINQLTVLITDSGVGALQAAVITERFSEFFANASEWKAKAEALTVTDEAQVAEMKMARVGRLALRNIRISVEHTRKELKADSLKQGQAIDTVAKALTAAIEPIEQHLEEQETFATRAKASRDAALKTKRTEILADFAINPGFYDLVKMPEADFTELVDGLKIAAAAKVEAAAKAEAEQLAAVAAVRVMANAEAAERAQMQQENEQLRAAAAQAETERIAEREEAKQLREQDAQAAELIRDRIWEKQLQEEAEKWRLINAENAALAAPDKVKLLALAATLEAVKWPNLQTKEAEAIVAHTMLVLEELSTYIEEKSKTL